MIDACIFSPLGNVIGKIISPGIATLSLQWIKVSSKSNTNVLKCVVLGKLTTLSS